MVVVSINRHACGFKFSPAHLPHTYKCSNVPTWFLHPGHPYFAMFSRSALLATFTLALAVAANPMVQIRDAPVTLPMVKRMNFTGTATLLERDQKRVQGFKARANAKLNGQSSLVEDAAGSVTATYQLVDYTVDVCSRIFLHLACICLHCT
jgi:hypothetical protein